MRPHKYLFKVEYVEEKCEIICYFKDSSSQIAKRFSFKPYFILDNTINIEDIKKLLVFFDFKNFNICDYGSNKIVSSNSFNNLKKISQVIAFCSGKKYLVLEPERVFLIEKDWSYFDSFCFEYNIPQKVFVEKDFSFFLIPNIDFAEALNINKKNLISLISQSALSNLLKLPIGELPENIDEQTESLLENIYFSNGVPITWKKENKVFSHIDFAPYGLFEDFSEIDFSFVWLQTMTNNFFNIGKDVINCDCCKPVKIDDKNILPSSLIEIIPLEKDFFYISTSGSFSNLFNINNPNKKIRRLKKNEFGLKNFPVGPLNSNNKYLVPLVDAIKLLDEKKVVLSKNHSLLWSCTKKESFFSSEIKKLNEFIFSIENELKKYSSNLLFENSFDYFFASSLLSFSKNIFLNIPFHLTKPFSKFSSIDLAQTIVAVQESVLFKFKEFSEQEGARIIYSTNKNVFLRSKYSLSLTRNFAKKLKLPRPVVSGFSKKHCFR